MTRRGPAPAMKRSSRVLTMPRPSRSSRMRCRSSTPSAWKCGLWITPRASAPVRQSNTQWQLVHIIWSQPLERMMLAWQRGHSRVLVAISFIVATSSGLQTCAGTPSAGSGTVAAQRAQWRSLQTMQLPACSPEESQLPLHSSALHWKRRGLAPGVPVADVASTSPVSGCARMRRCACSTWARATLSSRSSVFTARRATRTRSWISFSAFFSSTLLFSRKLPSTGSWRISTALRKLKASISTGATASSASYMRAWTAVKSAQRASKSCTRGNTCICMSSSKPARGRTDIAHVSARGRAAIANMGTHHRRREPAPRGARAPGPVATCSCQAPWCAKQRRARTVVT